VYSELSPDVQERVTLGLLRSYEVKGPERRRTMGSRKLRRGAAAVATVLGAGALVGATAASATNQYLKVNTIFNVLHDAGRRTAWSDKHIAYQMFDGPATSRS
jgi:hypothetical protein